MARKSDMDVIANVLGVNPATVRKGLEQGKLPFGTAIQCERRFSYVFFPKLVKEFLGVDLNERKDKETTI